MKNELNNSVRNILMNELGLTRDSIRTIMEEIVNETVDRKINQMINDRYFEKYMDILGTKIINSDNKAYPYKSLSEKLQQTIILTAQKKLVEDFDFSITKKHSDNEK